ncbi:VOC family protein [Antrihabitans stalactiti]|uniref:VOC family protein n=1 Tax=Antrihabitans stalactiti TaxID=2584121 RepID=A0A848KGL1_9NOCA|nr:VOC family protein [Antrihabitans stalactiti]NMN97311.1 VOC family protein [Antrihabitans stalactiti]
MLRGLATVNFFADDVTEAAKWYSEFLGIEPYFHVPNPETPMYVEFRIGDYNDEFGIINRRYAPHQQDAPGGAIVYWHVDDLAATVDRLVALGAKVHEKITPRGDSGFVTASVIDPFGNILGVMTNPHYLEVLGG